VPERLTIDVDATLITTHSEKEHAAGNYKGRLWVPPARRVCGRDARGARRSAAARERGREHRRRPCRRVGLGARADPGEVRRADRDPGPRRHRPRRTASWITAARGTCGTPSATS
jgi:hypothetical protein